MEDDPITRAADEAEARRAERTDAREAKREDGRVAAEQAVEANKHLPALPMPSYMAGGGARAIRDMDFLGKVNRIYADAELLRDFAMKNAGEADESLQKPMLMYQSINARLNTTETALKVVDRAWNLEYVARYMIAVVDMVMRNVSRPEERERIVKGLQLLNGEFNMTLDARMRNGDPR